MTPDEQFMLRAQELARLGTGYVSPNPRVGCVIVHDNLIIGEGWHQKFGQAHAEVNALQSVKDISRLPESTVYVSLEPCAHHGKTPPCADLLIRHRVKKVVISNTDPNPLVAGKGIKKLLAAGIEVTTGVLENEGKILNRAFFISIEKKRPWVLLKWAQTADGFIARLDFDSKWISNDYSRKLVHRWRSEEDAVLVGTNTALHDNPLLTVRDWSGRDPLRVVIDRHLRLPPDLNLFKGPQHTVVYTLQKKERHQTTEWVTLNGNNFPEEILHDLHVRGVQSVMIEGGAATLDLFISSACWDEARVFTASHSFGSGIPAPTLRGNLSASEKIYEDELKIWTP